MFLQLFIQEKNDCNCHLTSKLNNPKKCPRTYWSILKSFYNGKKIHLIPPLPQNNKLVSHFREKINLFINFFASQYIIVTNNRTVLDIQSTKPTQVWSHKANYLLQKPIISAYKFFSTLFGPIHSVFWHCNGLHFLIYLLNSIVDKLKKLHEDYSLYSYYIFLCLYQFPLMFTNINLNLCEKSFIFC